MFPQRRPPPSAIELRSKFLEYGIDPLLYRFDDFDCYSIERFDLILLRGARYDYSSIRLQAIATCLDERLTINPLKSMILARDKYTSIKVLERNGLPVPATFFVRNKGDLLKRLSTLGKGVLKPVSGSLGFGVTPITEDGIFYLQTPYPLDSVFQEELEKARDVRVLATREGVVAAMYRISYDAFATNYHVSKNADPAPKDLYEEIAVKALEALGLYYGGVDLIETPEGVKIIEVNPSPLWNGLSEVTGVDVAKELVKYFLKVARG